MASMRFHYLHVSALLVVVLPIACGGASEEERGQEPSAPAQQHADVSAPETTPVISRPGDLAGFVFEDRNRNGRFDAGDVRMAQQTVVLTNPDATQRIQTITTDGDGTFRFEKLPPADYRVSLQIPERFERTNDDSFLVTISPDQSVPEMALGIVRQ